VPYPNYASASAVLDELRAPALEGVAVLQVDHVGDFYAALARSDDPQLIESGRAFRRLAERWTGEWCCSHVPKGVPGHILYTMFADHPVDGGRAWVPRLGHTGIAVSDCAFSGPRNYTAACKGVPIRLR
jgi:hypothetical protein